MTPTAASAMLPELAEADAPPHIAAIYREMRETTAAPMVALIWRHLATLPGVIEEFWDAVGPLFRAGLVQQTAWNAAQEAIQAPAATVTPATLASAGIDAQGQAAFLRVLEAYNRVNPINFMVVSLLLHRLDNDGPARVTLDTSRTWQPPVPVTGIPPMASIAALDGEPRRIVDALCADPGVDRSTVVPSLYRHLVNWPGLFPAIHAALAPRFASGEILAQMDAVRSALRQHGAALGDGIGPLRRLSEAPDARAAFKRFSSLIPEMVVVGALLERGMRGA